jgi:hypothetical protein
MPQQLRRLLEPSDAGAHGRLIPQEPGQECLQLPGAEALQMELVRAVLRGAEGFEDGGRDGSHQDPTRSEHAPELGEGARGFVEMLQGFEADDGVEGALAEWQAQG